MTDFADEMCWWQVWDVGDQFKNHQHNKKVANIIDSTVEFLLPISLIGQHHQITNTMILSKMNDS